MMLGVFSKKTLFVCFFMAILCLTACQQGAPENKPQEGDSAKQGNSVTNHTEEEADSLVARSLFKTKARSVVGDVHMLKGGLGDTWKQVRIGNWVVENDRVQTRIESEAKLDAQDGSTLIISENSDVTLEASEDSTDSRLFLVSVGQGKVYFDIQKQVRTAYKFKTGTVGAAIRGTAGFVGNVKGKTIVSLKEGKVDVNAQSGAVRSVLGKQTILMDSQGRSRTLNLKSSGTKHLAKLLDSLARDEEDVESTTLQKSLSDFDSAYAEKQESLEDMFKKKLSFQSFTFPSDTLRSPYVTLRAFVDSGVVVTVWGVSDTVGADSLYKRTFTWAEGAYGKKRFLFTCSDGVVEIDCRKPLEFYYVDPDGIGSVSGELDENLTYLSLNLGRRVERLHLKRPKMFDIFNMKISLEGVDRESLKFLKSIKVYRSGQLIKTFAEGVLTKLEYEVPLKIDLNKIVDLEVVAETKTGHKFTAKKTYEVFCHLRNHPTEDGIHFNPPIEPDLQKEYELVELTRE